jgi:hypothetical protein
MLRRNGSARRIPAVRVALRLTALAVALVVPALSASLASAHSPSVVSPLAAGHAYRHGVVPFRGHGGATQLSANDLNYGGGIQGVGVTTGAPRVYLIFWGSQWGTQGTNSAGNATFSGDSVGMAPYAQAFMRGVGSGGETWSGVMTQYCQGVAVGTQTCPASNAFHVGYPTGGALAGVWADESAAAPASANGHGLGTEAVKAATHFGNTTQALNRNTQYVIISPHGTNPDNYLNAGFCAWHDYTADTFLSGGAVSSPDGTLAFTNLPYITDAGFSCGQGFVNSPGTLDGISIVEGHEYAETVTDQFPAGGWTDNIGNENGDKCAWIQSGQGASQDIALTTGSFAVQSTWANDFNSGNGGCEISHPIITNPGGNTVTVTNPGSQSSTVGTAVSLQIHATDSGSSTLTYSATGLPAGLSINSTSGLISGTPTTVASSSVTVKATDTTGAAGSASFSWTVSSGCTASQLLGNPGFETGTAAPWLTAGATINNSSAEPPHSGSWDAWLGGPSGLSRSEVIRQVVSVPSTCTTATFSFWLHIDTAETASTANDTLKVQAVTNGEATVVTLATLSNLNAAAGYTHYTYTLTGVAGQSVNLRFFVTENASAQTSFVIDDAALNVS